MIYLITQNAISSFQIYFTIIKMEFINSLIARGLAKPVSLSDISNRNYEGVPPRKVEWAVPRSGSLFEISIPLSLLKKHVNIVLSRIEGVRYKWDNAACIWFMEYGTEPMENKYKGVEFMQIKMGKMAAMCAACDAVRRFPHLIEEDNFDYDEPLELVRIPPRWCKMELRVYYDHSKECLFVHLNRMTGDHSAHWNIWIEINRYFQQNKLFLTRSPLLQLTEGIKYNKNNPIHRYLFDDMIIRELCTFTIL